MDRTAVFVDAGYLFAAGSKLIAGSKLPRGDLILDPGVVIAKLTELVAEVSGLPLLRIYWYDGTSAGPTPQQLALAYRPTLKLRLGFVNSVGEQKGVDSLIVTDLIELARNRAMADAVLVTGDEDIRVGVQQAQEFGVRVHLVGIAPAKENQSGFLAQEADTIRELSLAEVQAFLTRAPSMVAVPSPGSQYAVLSNAAQSVPPGELTPGPMVDLQDLANQLEATARAIANELTGEEKAAVLNQSIGGSVPSQVDRKLLTRGAGLANSSTLTSAQKRLLRKAFLKACQTSK